MEDFLPNGQDMEIAETVEIMEVTEDYEMSEKGLTETESTAQVREGTEREAAVSSTTEEEGVEIVDLSEIGDCGNLRYLQDSNILGKNFSAILSGSNMTIKNISDILSEDNFTDKTTSNNPPQRDDNFVTMIEIGQNDTEKPDNNNNNNNSNNNHQNFESNQNAANSVESPKSSNSVSSPCELRYYYEYNINNNFDCDLATNHIQENCDLGDLLEAERRVLLQPVEVLCHADEDGDTPLMIIVSKRVKENSRFYENVFAMQERLQSIRMCCEKPIEDFLEACPVCGQSDQYHFRTPLSCKNNAGDDALTCAMKMEHSEMVIDYLLAGISKNPNDLRKVFDQNGILFFQNQIRYYPSLLKFLIPRMKVPENYDNGASKLNTKEI